MMRDAYRAAIVAVAMLPLVACTGNSNSDPTAPTGIEAGGQTSGAQVEMRGAIAALSGSCPSLSFTINGQRIVTSGATTFDRTACADLRNGQTVEITGVQQSGGSVLASRVHREDDVAAPTPAPNPPAPNPPAPNPPAPNPPEAEVKGVIAGLSGACPSVSFTVAGQPVVTNGSTRFDGGACGDLRNGQTVEVEGVRQGDGSILANKVEREDEPPPAGQEVEITGTTAGLSGGCPNLSFTVGTDRVVTNGSTRFDDAACGDLRNGQRVEVQGMRQADRSILATRVKREDDR